MGRKMKSIIALFVVLALIYCQQSSFANAADEGKVFEKDAGRAGVSKSDGKEEQEKAGNQNSDGDKDDGNGSDGDEENRDEEDRDEEDGDKEDGDEGDRDEEDGNKEDGDKDKEEIESFQCKIPPEDGRNGYYISRPEIEILHVGKCGFTKYRFVDANGEVEEGKLNKDVGKARLEEERFQEGANQLSVWMEDEEGRKVEGYALEKTFLIDTQAPVLKIRTPQGFDAWYQKEVFISVAGADGEKGSQIEEITCAVGKQRIGESRTDTAGFRIAFASAGGKAVPVTVGIRDKAGNYAKESFGLYIDSNPPEAVIEGIQDYMITSQPVEVCYKVKDDNVIGRIAARAGREDPQGQTSLLETLEWAQEDSTGSARQILKDDGIYRLYVEAQDKAGNVSSSGSQVIIDSENPVIRHVDEVDGQYLKSFRWEYPPKEVVRDFTSFSYSISLDGRPYHAGEEISGEGVHVLEVNAADAAGNTSVAKAEFVVDHTPPTVIFTNVEEGKRYEEERSFQVALKEKEDLIEEIRINGERQKIDPKTGNCRLHVKECKEYEVSVKASDKAGNRVVSRMNFEVAEKKGLVQKLAEPVRKALTVPSGSGKGRRTAEGDVWEKDRKSGTGIIVIGAAIYVLLLGFRKGFRKARRRHNGKKRSFLREKTVEESAAI